MPQFFVFLQTPHLAFKVFSDDQLYKKDQEIQVYFVDNDPVPPWDWIKGARNSVYKKQTATTGTAALHGFHGNIKSHVFHSPSCSDYNCKGCVTVFDSKEDAIAAGYRPCKRCKP